MGNKYLTMSFLIYMTLVGLCLANYSTEQASNRMTPSKVTYEPVNDNPYIALSKSDDEIPDGIEFLQTIYPETGLMVVIIFGDDDDYDSQEDSDEDDLLNFCEFLDNALLDPDSSQAQYNMATFFGIDGFACPIEPGVKELTNFTLPINITTSDLGCGVTYYKLIVTVGNDTSKAEAIMELRVDLNPANKSETCIETSSSIAALSPTALSVTIILLSFLFL